MSDSFIPLGGGASSPLKVFNHFIVPIGAKFSRVVQMHTLVRLILTFFPLPFSFSQHLSLHLLGSNQQKGKERCVPSVRIDG